jgi:hypothetical protein
MICAWWRRKNAQVLRLRSQEVKKNQIQRNHKTGLIFVFE